MPAGIGGPGMAPGGMPGGPGPMPAAAAAVMQQMQREMAQLAALTGMPPGALMPPGPF